MFMYIYIYWVSQKVCSSFTIIKSYRKIQINFLANPIYLVCVCVFLCVLVSWSWLTLCDLMDYIPPGSTVHGILQSRILEWVAIPFSRGSSLLRHQTWVSHIAVGLFMIWATGEAHSLWLCTYIFGKFGKLSSGHRTGKVRFSFQSQRKPMPKNVQTTTQLHLFHMLAK